MTNLRHPFLWFLAKLHGIFIIKHLIGIQLTTENLFDLLKVVAIVEIAIFLLKTKFSKSGD